MRSHLVLLVALSLCAPRVCAAAAEPPRGLALVYALTREDGGRAVTTLYLHDVASDQARPIYRDPAEGARALGQAERDDLLGAVRTLPPGRVYLVLGAANAAPAEAHKAIHRLSVPPEPDEPAAPKRVLSLDAAAAGWRWGRAPLFAVAPDGRRFAIARPGVSAAQAAISIVGADGAEQRAIPLPAEGLEVRDLAWSPDGATLCCALLPKTNGDSPGEPPLARAGLYLAGAGAPRLLYPCYPEAVAWGPGADEITAVVRSGEPSAAARVAHVVSVRSGEQIREFSLRGPTGAIAHSPDGRWLAAHIRLEGEDQLWLHHRTEGWGTRLKGVPPEGGRLALAGWVALERR